MHKVIPYFGGYRRFDRVLLGIPRACSAVKGLARMRLVDNNGVPTRPRGGLTAGGRGIRTLGPPILRYLETGTGLSGALLREDGAAVKSL
jgi:hypothetical protein